MLINLIMLADIKEVLTAIVPLIMLIFWIISQVFGEKGAQAKQNKPAGNPRPKPDEGGLKAEIERFLQEAKQQQQQQKPRDQRDRDEIAEQERRKAQAERQRRKLEKKRREQEQQREAARQRAREISQRGTHRHEPVELVEDVQVVSPYPEAPREISPYQQRNEFSERASHLGEEVGQADERLESHLHEVFDHELGNFKDSPDNSGAREAARKENLVSVSEITSLLRNPKNFRQAIIMKEILDRPESRWT